MKEQENMETKHTTATIDDIMALNPCAHPYTRKRVTELFAGRNALSAYDVLDLKIPGVDRIWAILCGPLLTDERKHYLACDFAEHVLPIYECKYPKDMRPRQAIETCRRWLKGEATNDELAAAYAAARAAYAAADAAADAAARAAYAAAYAAADAAARAAYAAAYAAARAAYAAARAADAAAYAAADAADAAEREWQINKIREYPRKE